MQLIITDDHYLDTYKQIAKRWWYERNKGWLFLSATVTVYSLAQIIGADQEDGPSNDYCLFLLDVRFWYFMMFSALLVIAWWFYRQNVSLRGLPFMREFERQVGKTSMVYDLDEKRVRISYGHLVNECGWQMFQKLQFYKGYLIFMSSYYPLIPVWIPVRKENKKELENLAEVIQKKFKIKAVK
ncbi:hypothetical protein RYH73_11190 [Olivibacter sp. CPCC 100613]|uniref:hypothetical protein n=1 Tax=Olivibacter sp. CPCC 100613 TaxID=3079931 RepID=UPI002FF6A64E